MSVICKEIRSIVLEDTVPQKTIISGCFVPTFEDQRWLGASCKVDWAGEKTKAR